MATSGQQRYKCADCKRNFSMNVKRSNTKAVYSDVIKAYKRELKKGRNLSSRKLAKRFLINHVTVTRWINEYNKNHNGLMAKPEYLENIISRLIEEDSDLLLLPPKSKRK